ncbi:formylglycine-generating enzyme family protein [Paenibacillus sp. MMO-177]|uniref:formylglycine-generating enzyme family protein n=1 Tax=Paenibacillus sp. MMO-177 TaxID=3081289 RepID=UPI00301B644A
MNKKSGCCCAQQQEVRHADTNRSGLSDLKRRLEAGESEMVLLQGGSFLMGTDDEEGFRADGEGPIREVTLDPFYISPHAVTNAQFSAFVKDTGYITDAERYGWSYVFHLFVTEEAKENVRSVVQRTPWWWVVEGASWHQPEGTGSHVEERLDHPAVHISWYDADAYCQWAGERLLTEAEWEYAARGGLVQKRYPWGDLLKLNGEHHCNIWQGAFPVKNNASDGYNGTAPVDAYSPNGYGLFNMVGNVWEWCSDWFHPLSPLHDVRVNPQGPRSGTNKSMRGGSYLCHKSYCNRYRVAARNSNSPDSSSGNVGFRTAKSLK